LNLCLSIRTPEETIDLCGVFLGGWSCWIMLAEHDAPPRFNSLKVLRCHGNCKFGLP
jgi:hypothetical protein